MQMKSRILIIEDDKNLVETIKDIFEINDFDVLVAYNGAEGIENALKNKPDVIILDVGLSDISGFEVCKILKENYQTKFIPVIMLTGTKVEKEYRIGGLRTGADEYLLKPCDPEELLVRVESIIGRTRLLLDINPLTKLPGNEVIKRVVYEKIRKKEAVGICYIDIDNFKPYNDYYGYQKGDEMILFLANVIAEALKEVKFEDDKNVFVGHIGGDDFILLIPSNSVDLVCEKITRKFDEGILNFYNEDDRKKGFIIAPSREGDLKAFPIARISIAVVDTQKNKYLLDREYEHIMLVLSSIKKYLKKNKNKKGSTYMVDRRIEER
jgi:PleD family two-component response regulator